MVRIIQRPRSISPATHGYQFDSRYMQEWQYIQSYLRISNANEGASKDIDAAMKVLPHELVLLSYTDLIRTTFNVKIVPAISKVAAERDNLIGVVHNLSDGLSRYEACFARLKIGIGNITAPFQALVREQLDKRKWKEPFKAWIVNALTVGDDTTLLEMHKRIRHVGLSSLFEEELATILSTSMSTALTEAHANSWEESHLDRLLNQTIKAPERVLRLLGLPVESERLQSLARAELASLRISELFDIVIDFPTSAPALEDLKHCLDTTKARSELVTQYQQQMQARLLHPGANTPDIITVYISTIKVFLVLDPPGVLLDKVARPIRKYLRERTDTIRCIISSLLGEVDGDLAIELSEEQLTEEVDDQDDPDWLPDPIDAAPDYAKNRASDIIGSLISIYENKDVFVKELQTLLSDRLLAVTDYNIDQELRNLEMLKVRFGDGMLSVCDVMLKDVSDSRRIDGLVHVPEPNDDETEQEESDDNVLHTTVVSRLYWPTLKSAVHQPPILTVPDEGASTDGPMDTTAIEPGLRLPPPILSMMSTYSAAFRHLKAQRSLHFLKDLGHVRVVLDLQDRTFDMLVTPAHAASIYLFNAPDNDSALSLSLTQVSENLNVSDAESRKNLSFWQSQNILTYDPISQMYSVLDSLPTSTTSISAAPTLFITEEDSEDATPHALEQTWPFIIGMLTNVGPLPITKIQSMLGMFQPGYEKSEAQLLEYLTLKVRSGECDVKGGEYRLTATATNAL